MQTTFALAALAAVAYAAPQGVTQDITPSAAAPAGCSPTFAGSFEIIPVNFTTATRSLEKRACDSSLTITLAGGQLTDGTGHTGYIAANRQFQFDEPPQTGAIYTGGFSACSNGSLALGGSAVFYACKSGDFFNLYDQSQGAQCGPILIEISPCGAADPPAAGASSDGQPTATAVVSQISDNQPQAPTAVSEISDHQPQAPTAISEISDHQPQAPTALPISEISDHQPQAPTAVPISQISDGQIQATSAGAAPVSQISDGQIQATSAATAPVSQTSAAPISQISDGQIQAGNATASASAKPTLPVTGAATSVLIGSQFAALVVAVVAVALL